MCIAVQPQPKNIVIHDRVTFPFTSASRIGLG